VIDAARVDPAVQSRGRRRQRGEAYRGSIGAPAITRITVRLRHRHPARNARAFAAVCRRLLRSAAGAL